jgi:hypothetical protein
MFNYWREIVLIILASFIVVVPLTYMLLYAITASVSLGWTSGKARLEALEVEKIKAMTAWAAVQKEKENMNGKE